MTRWEYVQVFSLAPGSVTIAYGDGKTERQGGFGKVLNELGAEGWEAFATHSTGTVLMKRPA
jgi:hypothetical protein